MDSAASLNNGTNQKIKINKWTQISGTIVVSLAFLSLGTLIGYPTKALPELFKEENESVNLNEKEGSSFAAMLSLCGVIFSPLGGIFSGWLGRKNIILFTAPLVSCGWLIIALAQNKAMLFIGNILISAICTGQAATVMPYISETVHPSLRGSLVILPGIFMTI